MDSPSHVSESQNASNECRCTPAVTYSAEDELAYWYTVCQQALDLRRIHWARAVVPESGGICLSGLSRDGWEAEQKTVLDVWEGPTAMSNAPVQLRVLGNRGIGCDRGYSPCSLEVEFSQSGT